MNKHLKIKLIFLKRDYIPIWRFKTEIRSKIRSLSISDFKLSIQLFGESYFKNYFPRC